MKKTEYRKPIYEFVEKIIQRQLTADEHEELKSHAFNYAEIERSELRRMSEALQKQGEKLKHVTRAMYNIGTKKGLPEDEFAFLKKIFEA